MAIFYGNMTSRMLQSCIRLRERFHLIMSESIRYSSANIWMIGAIGLVGHPTYFFVWGYLFPQPYESFLLRAIGTILCLLMTLRNYWPRFLQGFLPYFWYGMLAYTLPFFFTYMLLRNDFNMVWMMSSVAAVFLTVLVTSLLVVPIISMIGILLAFLLFRATNQSVPMDGAGFLPYIPVYLFSIISGYAFIFFKMAVRDERKFSILLSAIRSMAHELRTPLAGIRGGSIAVANVFPALREAFESVHKKENRPRSLGSARLKALERTLAIIQKEVTHSNEIIDLLFLNAGSGKISDSNFRNVSILDCVKASLQRFDYDKEFMRKIDWSSVADFKFFGSETLMIHVLYNLMQNARHFLQKTPRGEVTLWTAKHGQSFRLHFKDTGPGIPLAVRRRIFDQFFTTKSGGDGIGLYFCKAVMTSFRGSITCRSQFGFYTEFILTFPQEKSHE